MNYCWWGLDVESNEIMCEKSTRKDENDTQPTTALVSGKEHFSGERMVMFENVAPWESRSIWPYFLVFEVRFAICSLRPLLMTSHYPARLN